MGALFSQIGAAFGSPLGLFVLLVAVAGIATVLKWRFNASINAAFLKWGILNDDGGNDPATENPHNLKMTKAVPPPLLAPNMFTGGSTSISQSGNVARYVTIGILGIVAVTYMLGLSASSGPKDDPFGDDFASDYGDSTSDASTIPTSSTTQADASGIIGPDPLCKPGIVDTSYPTSYQLCLTDQAARFDLIDFTRKGRPLLNANWNAQSGFTASADNQPTPFAFDHSVSMIGAADMPINQYDAFLAIGLSGAATLKPAKLAEERANSLATYVLENLRGEYDDDCQSNAMVLALSVGQSTASDDQGAMRPILIGIHYDRRYALSDRDMNALVDSFLASRGPMITGYNLANFTDREALFAQKACKRLF